MCRLKYLLHYTDTRKCIFFTHKKRKVEALSLHDMTSHWLHGNSIPKIGCHYFWPGLRALPKNTLPSILTQLEGVHINKCKSILCMGSIYIYIYIYIHLGLRKNIILVHQVGDCANKDSLGPIDSI